MRADTKREAEEVLPLYLQCYAAALPAAPQNPPNVLEATAAPQDTESILETLRAPDAAMIEERDRELRRFLQAIDRKLEEYDESTSSAESHCIPPVSYALRIVPRRSELQITAPSSGETPSLQRKYGSALLYTSRSPAGSSEDIASEAPPAPSTPTPPPPGTIPPLYILIYSPVYCPSYA